MAKPRPLLQMSAPDMRIGAISRLKVSGFKSVASPQSLEIGPLTVLAGANSSGKSTMLQGLLLLKQTLESQYDPGPLLIDGPNVRFSDFRQMRSAGALNGPSFGIEFENSNSFELRFRRSVQKRVEIAHVNLQSKAWGSVHIRPKMNARQLYDALGLHRFEIPPEQFSASVARSRCFLVPRLDLSPQWDDSGDTFSALVVAGWHSEPFLIERFSERIRRVVHLPGLRGDPGRSYPLTAVGEEFSGLFPHYAASVVATWASTKDERLDQLSDDLQALGLTWTVRAKPIDDTRVELQVGRLPQRPKKGSRALVNIADVGIGVSQVLPVVAALLTTQPGDVLYVEQPEIHLHPRAQFRLAEMLVRAANRGVRVVVETHSSLLLLGIQRLVAEAAINPRDVWFHWFQRRPVTGTTTINSVQPDDAGRTGEWPVDFGDVTLEATAAFLDASEAKAAKNGR